MALGATRILTENAHFLAKAPAAALRLKLVSYDDVLMGGESGLAHSSALFFLAARISLPLAEREKFEDPAILMRQMQQDGLTLAARALGPVNDPSRANQV